MTKYLCRIISSLNLIINDKVLMFLWLSVIDKKVAHPNEIQNTINTPFIYSGPWPWFLLSDDMLKLSRLSVY